MVLSVGIGAEYLMHGTVQQRGKKKNQNLKVLLFLSKIDIALPRRTLG